MLGRHSVVNPSLETWLDGWNEPTIWDARFDDFLDYIGQVVSFTLPWVCRAVGNLASFSEHDWVRSSNWADVAKMLQSGVDTKWAITALDNESPLQRTVLATAGRAAMSFGFTFESDQLFPNEVSFESWPETLCDRARLSEFGEISEPAIAELYEWLGRRNRSLS